MAMHKHLLELLPHNMSFGIGKIQVRKGNG